MNTQKLLLGTVVGSVVFFALDGLFYAVLMKDAFTSVPACDRETPLWPWLIAGTVIYMFVFTYLYGWGSDPKVNPVRQGLRYGSAMGVLLGFGVGFIWYSVQVPYDITDYVIDGLYTTVKDSAIGVIIATLWSKGGAGGGGDVGTPGGGGGTVPPTGGTEGSGGSGGSGGDDD